MARNILAMSVMVCIMLTLSAACAHSNQLEEQPTFVNIHKGDNSVKEVHHARLDNDLIDAIDPELP